MVNLSIQTAKDEIQSLRDKAIEMEAALDQRRLEMDTELTKSDDNAAAAVKEAERMTKLRLQRRRSFKSSRSNSSSKLFRGMSRDR